MISSSNQSRQLDEELARAEAEYRLALRLEKIRLDKATLVEGKFLNFAQALLDYPRAFREAGLAVEPGREKELARLIQQSAIKDQLVAALDDWARVEHHSNPELSGRVWEVARLADPDPWCDKVRNLDLWKNRRAMLRLAHEVQQNQRFLGGLSPEMLHLVSLLLPNEKREAWLRMAQALHPGDFWINFELAQVLAPTKEKLLEAAGFYRVALVIRPNTPAVYNNVGTVLAAQKDLPSAIDAFKKALAIDPKLALAWANLGAARAEQADLHAAIDAYKKALAISPKLAPLWHNLGNALAGEKDLPAAIGAYKNALAIDPKFAMAWNNLGVALADQKDLPGAIEAYKNPLAIDPKLAWFNLGNALADQKNLPAAIDAYKNGLAVDPKDAKGWYNLGHALARQKDLPTAIDAYKKALAIDRKDVRAWYSLGNALAGQNDLLAAIDAYKNALAIDPQYAPAWNNLGNALAGQNDLSAAIDAFKKALTISPKAAHHWYGLGNALRDQKELPAAIDAYKKAIRWNPDYAEAHCNLGLVLKDQGEFRPALIALEKGHQLGTRRAGWPYASVAWVKHCQELVALEKKLPNVLSGGTADGPERLRLADMCVRYKKRYADAVELYAQAFAAEPKWAETLEAIHRYHAACAAALAAAGKGAGDDKAEDKRAHLRRQALAWLQADLAARVRLLQQDPVKVHDDLQHWQGNADLAGVREEKELAKLAKDERTAWQGLWAQADALRRQARANYTQIEHKDRLGPKERERIHPIKMTAGKSYVIDIASPQFDTFLRLEDEKGTVLATNDDISTDNQNSRIIFTAPASGGYRIVATSFEHRGTGAYTLTIREFAARNP